MTDQTNYRDDLPIECGHCVDCDDRECIHYGDPNLYKGKSFKLKESKIRKDLANKKIKIKNYVKHPQVENFGGSEIEIEGYWDEITGSSWMFANGNPACLVYAMRTGFSEQNIPNDNEVLYGKVGYFGHLVHINELDLKEK